ncbi:MAG TPA: hypothetical protein ENG12_01635, partial [Candidatus Altiarchaeales archaeon]|nr:hypothetical protein [Candidatus Altiarchaeales archaeon]
MIKKYRLTPEGRNALEKNFELRTRFLGQNWLYELNYVLKDGEIFKDVLGHLVEGVGDGLYHGVAHTLASKGYHEGGQVLDFMVDKIRRYCIWRRIENERIIKNILRHSLEIVLNNPEDFKDIRTMVKKVKQKYKFRSGTIAEDAIVTHLVWNWTEEYTEIYKKVLSDLRLASRAKIRKGDYLLIPSPDRNERIIVDTEKNKLSIIKASVKKRTFRVETPELKNGEPIGLKDISVYTEDGKKVTLREFLMREFLRRGLYFEINENSTEAGGLVYVSKDRKTKIHRAGCHCQGINKSGQRLVGISTRDSALREKLSIEKGYVLDAFHYHPNGDQLPSSIDVKHMIYRMKVFGYLIPETIFVKYREGFIGTRYTPRRYVAVRTIEGFVKALEQCARELEMAERDLDDKRRKEIVEKYFEIKPIETFKSGREEPPVYKIGKEDLRKVYSIIMKRFFRLSIEQYKTEAGLIIKNLDEEGLKRAIDGLKGRGMEDYKVELLSKPVEEQRMGLIDHYDYIKPEDLLESLSISGLSAYVDESETLTGEDKSKIKANLRKIHLEETVEEMAGLPEIEEIKYILPKNLSKGAWEIETPEG